jgi:hypothetical protein
VLVSLLSYATIGYLHISRKEQGWRVPVVKISDRFVAQGIGQAAPWENLNGQIWLGRAKFLKRMEPLTQGKSLRNVLRPQQRPAGPTPEAITALVQNTYRTKDEKTLLQRAIERGTHDSAMQRLLESSASSC